MLSSMQDRFQGIELLVSQQGGDKRHRRRVNALRGVITQHGQTYKRSITPTDMKLRVTDQPI